MTKSSVKDRIIMLLNENKEGIPQSLIHKILNVSKSWVSEILRDLELSGVIERISVGHQYIVRIRKTPVKEVKSSINSLKIGIVWSSEYPFLTPFAKKLRRDLDIDLDVVVYPNALRATWALVNGEVDLALSPLITQIYAYSLTKALRIIGGGAYGGAAIIENENAHSDIITSSELSTMDLFRAIAINSKLVHPSKTIYLSKPEDIFRLINKLGVRYFVIWHPILEKLVSRGFKIIARWDDFDLGYCCTLAASIRIHSRLRRRIAIQYHEAIEYFIKSPEKWIDWYAAKVGISSGIIRRGLKYYGFRPYLDIKLIYNALKNANIMVPDPSTIKKAIEYNS